jgi:cytochrome c oxidase subunit 2
MIVATTSGSTGRDRVSATGDRDAGAGARRAATGRRLAACALVACVAASGALLAGCGSESPDIFRPGGSAGEQIRELALQIFLILSLVLATVWALLAIVIVRFRNRSEADVSATRGNLKIEIVWTLIPTVIVVVLFILTVRTTQQIGLPDTGAQFTVTGYQWWWEFDFPDEGFVTANEVHVPVGRQVSADVVSEDVIHSFWVPQMAGKVDMIPGHVNHTTFIPLKEGRYLGECSEFCGAQHGKMRFLFVVESPDEFSAWLDRQQQPAAAPTGAAAIAGAEVIASVGCGGCHRVRGTGLAGASGPDLTHFGSRGGIAAWALTNTPDNLLAWLQDPQAIKPEAQMPRVVLPLVQQTQLVAYLGELQ